MLPGKKFAPEDILRILNHRKWFIAVPFVIAVLSTALIAHRLPKRWQSETLILVVPQRVPDSYVRSTVTTRIEDRLTSLRQEILSRSRLERVILDYDLYPQLRRRTVMEDVVETMRRDIDVKVERGDAFRVSYISTDPRLAQRVAERLASLFINENLREREVQAEGTNQFLDSQLEDARRRLLEQEKKLEDYKRQYSGQLPTQAQSNLQAIQNAQMQLQALAESMNRDRDRRLVLERQVADLNATPVDVPAAPTTGDLPAGASLAQQLEAAQARLRALQAHYTDEHPDVKAMKGVVRDLEAKVRAAGPAGPTAAPVNAAEMIRQNRLRDLRAEIQNVDNQLARKQDQEKALQGTIASYQAKVDAVPTREAEMTELTRDYATLQTAYTALLAKREDSKIAANLERNQAGEQFKVLDPARVPERPYSPNVLRIDLAGAALGLMIGLGLVALLEYRDVSFRTEAEINQLLQLPVLALIPMMASERERRASRRRRVLVGIGFAVVVVSSALALALWKMQTGA